MQETVVGVLAGTVGTVLVLICLVAGMMARKMSSSQADNSVNSRKEEYFPMERQNRNGETAQKEVNYEVARNDQEIEIFDRVTMDCDSSVAKPVISDFEGRETFIGERGFDPGGGEDSCYREINNHRHKQLKTELDYDDSWVAYGSKDTNILIPGREGYASHHRTNIKLNPLFD